MKATELRIGNWINYIGSGDVQLSSKEALCNVFDDLESEYPLSSPIPLTEEWLLKFGFELKDEVNMGFIKQINFPHMKNYLYANSKFYTTALWDDKKQIEIFIMNQAKYVHQLQNLYFALTGEELTIK